MDAGRIKALAVLGYNFSWHMLRSALPSKKPDQEKLFLSYLRDDRISALTAAEWSRIFSFERCVVCGLCPAHCRVMEEAPGRFLGPLHIAASASRSQPDFVNDLDSLLLCAVCGQCEPICPKQVPVAAIASAMRSYVWRVADEFLPDSYHRAAENLTKHGNIYGEPLADLAGGGENLLVLGPRLALNHPRAERLQALLKKLEIDCGGVEEGSIGGVAENIGLIPETAWVGRLAEPAVKSVIVADPEMWLALRQDPRLADKPVKWWLEAVAEKLPPGFALTVEGPVAVHEPPAIARRSAHSGLAASLIGRAGIQVVAMSRDGRFSPPVGWEGGIELVDTDLAKKMAKARIADTKSAGAKTLVTISEDDAILLGSTGDRGCANMIDLLSEQLA